MRKQSKKRQQHRTLAEPPRLHSPCAPQRGVCSPLPRPWGAVLYPLLPLALSTASSSSTCSSGESKHLHRPQEARWNEKLQGAKPRVRASTQTRCSREEEMPACPSPKVKTKLHTDVKGQRFPLHPCHVQVTRQAFGASCLARVIHPTAAIALHLHIQKQTLRPSREGGCLGFPHPHSHSHQGQPAKRSPCARGTELTQAGHCSRRRPRQGGSRQPRAVLLGERGAGQTPEMGRIKTFC